MACTPISIQTGLFINATASVWNNFSEAVGGVGGNKSASYNSGTLTVTGPNGSTFVTPGLNQAVRHKFFGTGNFMAVLTVDTGQGPVTRSMVIIDFTAPSPIQVPVLQVIADNSINPLPFLAHSRGNGAACFVGAPSSFGLAGLAILRSDNGSVICPGPPPLNNSTGIIDAEATASDVQITQGAAIIAGPCPFPSGQLSASPSSQNFPDVKVGGDCPQPASTKTFTLLNTGNDCIAVSAIGAVAPYSVTAQSKPFPADLGPNESMTVTVTFAPGAVGPFNNVNLPVTRNPARGDSQLNCFGRAVPALPSFTVLPASINFGTIPVGTAAGPETIDITNNGDVQIAITAAAAPPGPFQWIGFNGQLTCGQSHSIAVTFTPLSAGPAGPQIVTIAGLPGGNHSVTLNGDGCIPNALIGVPPLPFPDFKDVRQSYRMVRFITVTNTGDGPLTFTASLTGPDAAAFGIMRPSNSITDVVQSQPFEALPVQPCGGGAVGPGNVQVAVVFFADPAFGLGPRNATLTIGNHNDPAAPATFPFPLTANIVPGNVVDVAAVFDKSGSMGDSIPGGGRKVDAAVQAGQLLVQLIPPDLGNRAGVTRFSTIADSFEVMQDVTAGNQAAIVGQINATTLAPGGNTAIAAGAMVGLKQFAVPRAGAVPATLSKAMIVLTDGKDNTAFFNPDDNKFYTVTGIQASNPTPPPATVATNAFAPPGDVKVFAVGLGTGQDIDLVQLAALSSGAGGKFLVADPASAKVGYQLMKYYTQIYMDLVDFASISDPDYLIYPGQTHSIEFDLLRGDMGAMVVIYDLMKRIRLPFFLQSPKGEVIDANFVPPGFQLRSGFTNTSRFLDFRLPPGEPDRYAGRWKVIIRHDGRACLGDPKRGESKELGFRPGDCQEFKDPIEYGIAIGAGSNFRLQAYVTPGPVQVGQPILLAGVVSEAELPVAGCTVTVDAVAPGGQSWHLTLADDGAHQDGEANDGEYAKEFTNTAIAGSYVFTFRATGQSHDKEPVTRETVLSKYVEGWLTLPPPGGGRPGGDDECCKRLVHLLEQQNRLLGELVREEAREAKR
ncbi:MAG: choice-of-anchor D domain-containing protein [Methylocella sp.]